MSSHFYKVLFVGSCGAATFYSMYPYNFQKNESKHVVIADSKKSVPRHPLLTRNEQLKALQAQKEYDILVIGGGATGAGVALDSISRGLKTALVELDDFSSGTSSRSTKLIHGGVRYLQKAILHFDWQQYRMVKEALDERANFLVNAPHLAYPFPIMLPIYKWWQVPYFWVGIKVYDLFARKRKVKSSYFLSCDSALGLFPMLKRDGLCGAIVYYDGMHNDARMNLSIIITAARMGANVANHVAVINLLKAKDAEGNEKLCGVRVRDMLTEKEWDIRAKCVINATGPFTDCIRRMDDTKCALICQPSAGVHIVLPDYYSPENMGLLDPETSDGRMIFFLPWEKMTIAGSTDRACEPSLHPSPTEEEIQFILNEIKDYFSPEIAVRRGDVTSAWSGIRPLVMDPNKKSTEGLARNHILHISGSNLITIAGGKWTTYRVMAKDTVDAAVEACNLQPKSKCITENLKVEGAHGWTPNMYIALVQDYGFEAEVAQHLASTYGSQAYAVANQASLTGQKWPVVGRRLHERFPYIEAEVHYAIQEYACTAIDVIARRLRLSFLNVEAAKDVLPTVISLMAKDLKWDKGRQNKEYQKAIEFLHTEMGQEMNIESRVSSLDFSEEEIASFTQKFQFIDKDKKGFITLTDLKMHLYARGEDVDDKTLHDILSEVNPSKNGQVQLEEYLLLMSAIKTGVIPHSRLATAVDIPYIRSVVDIDQSGGGV